DAVLRHDGGGVLTEAGVLRLQALALIAVVARVEAVLGAEIVVEANAARVLVDPAGSADVDDIEQRVGGSELAHREGAQQGANGRRDAVGHHGSAAIGSSPDGRAERAFHERRAGPLPQRFEAPEEEQFVLNNGPADAAAELIQPQLALRGAIEKVAG